MEKTRSNREERIVQALFLVLTLAYLAAFISNLRPYWFNPHWTTDDAQQQSYPFYTTLHPEAFLGDLVTEMMRCYLSPLHRLISSAVILVTGNPVMMGHWVMLFQILLTAGFLFFAVMRRSSLAPALVSLILFLHTRNVIQRLTGGLPRGWAAPIFAAYLLASSFKTVWGVIAVIFVGCLLHPPATLLVALAYGIQLLWNLYHEGKGGLAFKNLIRYAIFSPLFLLLTYTVVRMPPEIGHMASYQEAAAMPEFSREGGRFPFVPLVNPFNEIWKFGFQVFVTKFYDPGILRDVIPSLVLLFLGVIIYLRVKRGRTIIPRSIWSFFISSIIVYVASRIFAFRLYVPDRHIQFPWAFFFMSALPVACWRMARERPCFAALYLLALLGIVSLGSGSGLYGPANFNTVTRKGPVWDFIKNDTPVNSVIAGQPTALDPLQLLTMRAAYVTTETAHPFYSEYYSVIRRRLETVWRAYYARDTKTFLRQIGDEKIDYFVFVRNDFRPEALAKASYFRPFNELVQSLTARPADQFAFRSLEKGPWVAYRDPRFVVVDLQKLRAANT